MAQLVKDLVSLQHLGLLLWPRFDTGLPHAKGMAKKEVNKMQCVDLNWTYSFKGCC